MSTALSFEVCSTMLLLQATERRESQHLKMQKFKVINHIIGQLGVPADSLVAAERASCLLRPHYLLEAMSLHLLSHKQVFLCQRNIHIHAIQPACWSEGAANLGGWNFHNCAQFLHPSQRPELHIPMHMPMPSLLLLLRSQTGVDRVLSFFWVVSHSHIRRWFFFKIKVAFH